MAGERDITPTRQIKFKPNKPSTRKIKPVSAKISEERVEADEVADECPQHLIRRVNEHLSRGKSGADKKPTQVAFGPAPKVLRAFEKPSQVAGRSNSVSDSKDSAPGNGQNLLPLPYTAGKDEAFATGVGGGRKKEKKYREPWDYENSCYPITLPLRRPNSGDPEIPHDNYFSYAYISSIGIESKILDEAEFGKATTNLDYDENSIDAASELGLREKMDQQRMFFFQLPSDLPSFRGNAAMRGKTNEPARGGQKLTGGISNQSKGKEIIDNCNASNTKHNLELSKGFMGKMLVYKSGAVKLKLGEILYDVSPGSDCSFAQHVAAMNTTQKYFCELGELDKRAVVTPDIDSLLESMDE
ncbi:hypothetical protein Leryth_023507 [Lithospermum erythrorhizon]|nr:hypothetical protein Leryth_023507 [Lithospermum erythrorhizon]